MEFRAQNTKLHIIAVLYNHILCADVLGPRDLYNYLGTQTGTLHGKIIYDNLSYKGLYMFKYTNIYVASRIRARVILLCVGDYRQEQIGGFEPSPGKLLNIHICLLTAPIGFKFGN